MGFFEQFPYTNFHQLNLDWLLNVAKDHDSNIKKLDGDIAEISAENERFRNEIRNYVSNLDIPAIVGDKLTDMLESGEFADIVESSVFADFNNRLNTVEKTAEFVAFIPSGDDIADYRRDSLRCLVSHLVHAVGADSVVPGVDGLQNIDTMFAPRYSDGNKTYIGVFGQGDGFVTTDRVEIGGISYPVAYLDCSSFVTLGTRCRFYGDDVSNQKNESPYHYAFKYNYPGTNSGVADRCVEAGSSHIKPYVFDFLNFVYTSRMAYMSSKSGNRLHKIASRATSTEEPVYNADNVALMETGDIIFNGRISDTSRYLGIGHCLYYVKTLAELNEISAYYNATIEPVGAAEHPEHGYVIHVSTAFNPDNTYNNVIRVQTMYDAMFLSTYTESYFCKPYSNAFISNKARRLLGGTFEKYDSTYFVGRVTSGNSMPTSNGYDESGNFKFKNLALRGAELPTSVSDVNRLPNGFWVIKYSAQVRSTVNLPQWIIDGGWGCHIISMCVDTPEDSPKYGFQICFNVNSAGSSGLHVFMRSCTMSDGWGPWKEFSIVA